MFQDLPRPENPDADPGEAVRWDILMHASELFLHYGFSKTNIGDIAERSGMSPGNLYRYFKNKQAIGLSVVEKYFQMVQAGMETVLMFPEGTPRDRIHQFLRREVEDMVSKLEEAPRLVEMADFVWEDDDGFAILQSHFAWKRRHIGNELQRGIDAGDFRPIDDLEDTARIMSQTLKPFSAPFILIRWRDKSTILPEFDESFHLIMSGIEA
ncbi:MAG: TetR/AcrR family transcriptional regulator, partial [Pseudomonadota bacterium]